MQDKTDRQKQTCTQVTYTQYTLIQHTTSLGTRSLHREERVWAHTYIHAVPMPECCHDQSDSFIANDIMEMGQAFSVVCD